MAIEGKWFNPANLLTALRVALAPVIILLLLADNQLIGSVSNSTLAGIVFIIAALTDKADGYYARKYDAVTRLGQSLDPLADKLLMIPVLITLACVDPPLLPWWAVTVVVARELLISGIRVAGARRKITFPASWSGKLKMFSQVVVVGLLIFFPGSAHSIWMLSMVYFMVAITAYSGFDYIFRARREIFASPSSDVKE
jgi:CDP-diacylglycerol--glycerol-3-phosphate 3-phosphatidyltransferase